MIYQIFITFIFTIYIYYNLQYHRRAGYGECLDILTSTDWKKNFNFDLFSMDRYNTIIKYKTSYFSFVLPFILAMRFVSII